MKVLRLMGEDHTEFGRVAVEAAGPVAIGISRGRHPKAYYYVDPNEDAVMAITDDQRSLLVVADGHHGLEASHATLPAIAEAAPAMMGLSGPALLERLMGVAIRTVSDATRGLEAPKDGCETAMAMATVGPDGGAAVAAGDCAAVRIRARRSRIATDMTAPFLGPEPPAIQPKTVGFRVRPGDLVMVATDGLIDFIGRPWPTRLAAVLADHHSPEETVRAAINAAGDGGGGDNVAVGSLTVAE